MKIYIEVLVIIILILVVLVWALWMAISKYIYVRRYKPENDKGERGEQERQRLIKEGLPNPGTRDQFSRGAESTDSIKGSPKPREQIGVQTTDTNNDREDSNSSRKSSSSDDEVSKSRRFRNPFKRRGKR